MKPHAPNFLYVIDASLHVVLAGPSPIQLVGQRPDARLPRELEAPLTSVLAEHDFDREPIARATSSADVALRCMRASGPAGSYYMVMARQVPAVFQAVA